MKYYFIFIFLFLAACQTDSVIVSAPTTVYPDLPSINIPPMALVWPVEDAPRDLTKTVPMNTTECLTVEDSKRDKAYWDRCGEHPIIDSNIFLGYDQHNWGLFKLDMEKVKARLLEYKQTIDQVNQQRAEWRSLNQNANNASKRPSKDAGNKPVAPLSDSKKTP